MMLPYSLKVQFGDFLVGPAVKNPAAKGGTLVWSLIGELRSHASWGS